MKSLAHKNRAERQARAGLLALGAGLILLLSACTVSITPAQQSSQLSVGQVLQKSSQAMQKLKSFAFTLTASGTLQGTNQGQASVIAGATPRPGTATPVTTASASPAVSLTFNVTGTGQQSLADGKQALNLTLNQTTRLAEIIIGQQVYLQNPRGQWYVIDASHLQTAGGNLLAGWKLDTNAFLTLALHSRLTDHGDETLAGQSLRHISAVLDKEGLRQLLMSNTQLSTAIGSQNLDNLVNQTRSFQATIDLWIDETQFYLHRVQLKLAMNADTQGLLTPVAGVASTLLPPTLMVNLSSIVDLKHFNQPLTISAPSNAIPTDDPASVFQAS
ncbi:hypothetical protein [Thermogemmatispora sp.]|uniref:hypothetical protein n=1 Tax=Thermogemmatispora sp. TaxID=1968838 RepID=UPI002ACC2A8C|nr:hypothetical protein [Thermogemmatispora sp.]